MITLNKLEIYKKYHGDGDMFLRIGTSAEKAQLNYNDWMSIDRFIQDLIMISNSKVSIDYVKRSEDSLSNICENDDVKSYLKQIAEELSK